MNHWIFWFCWKCINSCIRNVQIITNFFEKMHNVFLIFFLAFVCLFIIDIHYDRIFVTFCFFFRNDINLMLFIQFPCKKIDWLSFHYVCVFACLFVCYVVCCVNEIILIVHMHLPDRQWERKHGSISQWFFFVVVVVHRCILCKHNDDDPQ